MSKNLPKNVPWPIHDIAAAQRANDLGRQQRSPSPIIETPLSPDPEPKSNPMLERALPPRRRSQSPFAIGKMRDIPIEVEHQVIKFDKLSTLQTMHVRQLCVYDPVIIHRYLYVCVLDKRFFLLAGIRECAILIRGNVTSIMSKCLHLYCPNVGDGLNGSVRAHESKKKKQNEDQAGETQSEGKVWKKKRVSEYIFVGKPSVVSGFHHIVHNLISK